MSDQNPQQGDPGVQNQQSQQAEDTAAQGSQDANVIIQQLTAQIDSQNTLIDKLRGFEKQAKRGERIEKEFRNVLDTYKSGVSEEVINALAGIPIENQFSVLKALKNGTVQQSANQPVQNPSVDVAGLPQQVGIPASVPTVPFATPRPSQQPIQSAYDREMAQLQATGQWNSQTALELVKKYQGQA
jgi:hypothetical protein